jgi:hypothetical protein
MTRQTNPSPNPLSSRNTHKTQPVPTPTSFPPQPQTNPKRTHAPMFQPQVFRRKFPGVLRRQTRVVARESGDMQPGRLPVHLVERANAASDAVAGLKADR